jgi:hypothetical protein
MSFEMAHALSGAEVRAGRSKVRIGIRLIAAGLLILLVQAIVWIDQGYWTAFNIDAVLRWSGLRPYPMPWSGAQAIVDWILAFPLSAVPLAFGFSIAWSGAARAVRAGRYAAGER